jgi:hypothetical protein
VRASSLLVSAVAAAAAAGCVSFYEVTVETPIQAKLDVTPFSRVLVVGFLAGGTSDVDANLETVRLLRSQLRSKSPLKVIETDVLPLLDAARKAAGEAAVAGAATAPPADAAPAESPAPIKDEQQLEPLEKIFADKEYWKKIGEEYQGPLIVTGTVMFMPHARSGYVQREQEVYDTFGRRRVVPVRTYMERKGFILKPKFVFIDGRTGETLYAETYREEILYSADQSTPALSSYFELMDRLVPSFLSALSSQTIKGTRVLLK